MCKCVYCNREFSDLGYLQNHLRTHHKMSLGDIEEYYIKYYKKDGEGIDPITGGKTDFISLKRGYKRYEKNNSQKLATNTVEHYLLKGLSLEEAQERVNYTNKKSSEYLTKEWKNIKESGKTRGGWSKQHFLELGYSEEDAEIEMKKRSQQREEKMAKYRERAKETGEYKLYKTTCVEYWLNKGYSEEEARNELKRRQATNTLESYQKKYGEFDGLVKFKERNTKWSLEMEKRYHTGEYSRDSNKNGKGIINRNYSNSEKELALVLYNILLNNCDCFEYMSISTGDNKQYFIFDDGRYYFYDIMFRCGDNRKIIEFNGDYWHMNPVFYNKDDYNVSIDLTAGEIWDIFEKKIDSARKNGFQVCVVWENDWKNNKEQVIDYCIKFLIND